MTGTSSSTLALIVALAVSGPSVALADPAPALAVPPASGGGEAHIARGLELRRERRDEEALAEFRAAYALDKRGRALAQVALAEDALGLWVEAEEALEEVLSGSGDAWVEKRRPQLEGELAALRAHLADLELEIAPPAAEVLVNGALSHRHAASGTFRIVSGRVLVEVKAAGYETARRVLQAPPGARLRETIALMETPPPPIPLAPAPSPSPAVDPPRPAPSEPPLRPPESRARLPNVLVLSTLAVAGAAFITGTVGAVGRSLSLSTYNDNGRCDYGGVPRSERCAGAAADVDRFTTVMAVGYATAAAAALTGGVLAFAFPRKVRVDVAGLGSSGFMTRAQIDF